MRVNCFRKIAFFFSPNFLFIPFGIQFELVSSFHPFILQLLDLSRNQLNGFDDHFVAKLQRIKDVRLENNPLICDKCHMGSLIDVASTVSNGVIGNACSPGLAEIINTFGIHWLLLTTDWFSHKFQFDNFLFQLQWKSFPLCFLPEPLRGAPISDLNADGLEYCYELSDDESPGVASTVFFLQQGGYIPVAIICFVWHSQRGCPTPLRPGIKKRNEI